MTATMRDEGEKICPLCAEEMDLTDQHLKPCKCGYEICVWCWHQIMTLAEKDDREGRCPACRTPYNREKIVATSENCKSLVAEMNMERKLKSQKAKSKTSEGRKQLSNMRVIQRNLVYIMCLPLNLADEDVSSLSLSLFLILQHFGTCNFCMQLLQQKEYFGQYGKLLKVSMSRTAAGSIQQFPNNTCSVYVTYSKEEEAIRCIQSVHGFVLDGRALRAFFGTTKYCHAWLRNMPCSNPECLYLHEFGSEEDRVTKDEIISTYTRNRVQHISDATYNMQRRSGNVLPPPPDERCTNNCASFGKPTSESVSNNSASTVKGSPPNRSSDQSVALPVSAAWGTRSSINQLPSSSFACSNGPHKQRSDTCSGSLACSMKVASSTQVSMLQADAGRKVLILQPDIGVTCIHNDESCITQQSSKFDTLESKKQCVVMNCQTTISGTHDTLGHSATSTLSSQLCCPPDSKDKDGSVIVPSSTVNSIDLSHSYGPSSEKDLNVSIDGKMHNLCSSMSSVSIGRHQGLQPCKTEQYRDPLTLLAAGMTFPEDDACVARKQLDLKSDPQTQTTQIVNSEVEDDLLAFDIQRIKDPEVFTPTGLPNLSRSFNILNNSRVYSGQHSQTNCALDIGGDLQAVDKKFTEVLDQHEFGRPEMSNVVHNTTASKSACSDDIVECFNMLPDEVRQKQVGGFEGGVVTANHNAAVDRGENSIISNILSMDFDFNSWDEPFTSPQTLFKILGETDRQQSSVGLSNSWKVQNSNQSRFSFAREFELVNKVTDVKSTLGRNGQALSDQSLNLNFTENEDFYLKELGNGNGFSSVNVEESDNFARSNPHSSTSKLPSSRAQISAPPGFSLARRTPPAGFTSHEKMEQPCGTHFGNYMSDSSCSLRNQYLTPPTANIDNPRDIEFIDPAILAVGRCRLPGGLDSQRSISPMFSAFQDEASLQMLMQRPLSQHQNQRFTDMGEGFSHHNGIPTSIMEKTLGKNLSPFTSISFPQSRNAPVSSGLLKGWGEDPSGHNLGMAEQARTERTGINKLYTGYEDPMMWMCSSGDLYNRTFGI